MNQPSNPEFPIDLQNVTRRFGRQIAVNDLTLRIPRGKTLGFIGLNGAGKTAAIRMMVGLLAPHAGTIRIEGIDVPRHSDRMKSRVGYVPDRPHVYPWMRVQQALDFARAFYPTWNAERCGALMKLFALDPRKRAKHLSKGQAAKLSLLLTNCHNPSVLILDEPTSGLDPLVREEFLEGVLAATADRGQTVLFSSHALADVQRLADSIALMHEGRLILHGPVEQLLDCTKRIRAVLDDETSPHEPPPGHIWQQLRGREWLITVGDFTNDSVEFVRAKNHVTHLEVEDLSLDDVFKDYVRGRQNESQVANEVTA